MNMNKNSVLDLLGVEVDSYVSQFPIKIQRRNERQPYAEIVVENNRTHYRFGTFDRNGIVIISD